MTTLYDVAKLAGVSPKTVSRVLNESHLVAEETRQRVLNAIEKLDYHPNAIAASLKRNRANKIGFIVPYGSDFVFQDPNMMEQLRGTHDYVSAVGFELIVSAPLHKKDALQEALRLTKNRNVDGVILYPSYGVDQIIKEFQAKNLRYVTLGICYDQQKNNFVEVDQTPGSYLATKYLISLGHQRIGLLNKPYSFFMVNRDDLLNGYITALKEGGIEYIPSLVREGNFTFEDGYEKFKELIEEHPDLTAVICASDPMTYGTIRAIADLGLNNKIHVVAGDNLPLTQKLFPQLSSITNPSYEQGRQAGKMIVTIINEGRELPGVTLNTEFVIRNMHPVVKR
ncbi:MAG: LacI family transcriptional regulator [Firmicutes bacterium]|nr:LacI family transcriptional regulator [Bacillota bacterium]